MTVAETLYEFFSTQLGLLVFGSIVIPLMFGVYARYQKFLEDTNRRELLTRVIIYRYGLIENACNKGRYDEVFDIIRGNSGGNYQYNPMMPDIENNINIFGLIMGALNRKELSKGALPEQIEHLSQLSKILNEITEYVKGENPPEDVKGETLEVDSEGKNQEVNPKGKNHQKHPLKKEHIRRLSYSLNQLRMDAEEFKTYFDNFQNSIFGIHFNDIRISFFQLKLDIASLRAKKFQSSIGSLIYPAISLKQANFIRPGIHFGKRKKFYYDKEHGFRIAFPLDNWFASDYILRNYLKKEYHTGAETQIPLVLVRKDFKDFSYENVNIVIYKRKQEHDLEECLKAHIKDIKDTSEKIKVKWNCKDKATDPKTRAAILEAYPVERDGKTYYQLQRFIMGFKKVYTLTATFTPEEGEYFKDELREILNSFVLIE
jgi:hypothetical protein